MSILVTGGTGYIGSHTVVELIENGYDVIVVDSLNNSSRNVIDKIEQITKQKVTFYEVNILNKSELHKIFKKHHISAVIHFSGLKSVSESIEKPLMYYENNVMGTLALSKVMQENQVFNLVFSSSATVYGIPGELPLQETSKTKPINPYGQTKLMCEKMLEDLSKSNDLWNIALLRYFNPVGAHSSGLIGEEPNGIPNNLMPFVTKVAIGELDSVQVFGDDYPTEDGTGVRDYIHVTDLARGHIKALQYIGESIETGVEVFNLGTGNGYSVLEVIHAFEESSGVNIPYEVVERRSGDVAESFADPRKANEKLNWKTEKGLKEICNDIWKWIERTNF